jgi:glycosyltransferase involved in cell wall biosynthesis
MAVRRLLFLTPFPPRLDAAHGGSRVAAQLISRLAERHRVAVLALRLPDEEPGDEVLRERCEVYEEVVRPLVGTSIARLWAQRQRLPLLLAGAPAWVIGCSVAEYGARLRALVRAWRPEIVQFEYAMMGQYARHLMGAPPRRVLVEYDPGEGSPRPRWARYRRAVMRRVDAVVVFTARDEEVISPLVGDTRLSRIPIGVDLPSAGLDPLGQPPPSLLFVGSYSHPPNVEAAQRLATKIVPRVRERYPDVVLYLVGDNPPTDLDPTTGLVVTGRVPDVKPYLDRAAVVLAPLRSGGGMRVKVLEALASGKATVATPLAVEGLDVVDGEHVLLADSDDEIVAAILSLLLDPGRRSALAARARAWALTNLGWENALREYETLYDSLLKPSLADGS